MRKEEDQICPVKSHKQRLGEEMRMQPRVLEQELRFKSGASTGRLAKEYKNKMGLGRRSKEETLPPFEAKGLRRAAAAYEASTGPGGGSSG